MKNCPHCNEKPISLIGWCSGINAVECKCAKCGAKLKADVASWVVMALISLVMVIVVVVAIMQYDVSIRHDMLTLVLLLIPPAVIGSIIGYYFAGYRTEE